MFTCEVRCATKTDKTEKKCVRAASGEVYSLHVVSCVWCVVCCVVVYVVEWFYYYQRIIVGWADLNDFFFVDFHR